MTLVFTELPTVSVEPPGAPRSEVWAPPGGWSRRRVLGAIGGAAVASGLGVLGLFPWSRPGTAFAAAYTAWPTCHGFFDINTTCVPTNAYFGDDNCDGQWHRNETLTQGCESMRYIHDWSSCDGNNAWQWGGPNARGEHGMCSDGWRDYTACDGSTISRFSVCRTPIP